ncbi:MAG: serine hydrolase domain-containing protein [Planctomycetota bacterium]
MLIRLVSAAVSVSLLTCAGALAQVSSEELSKSIEGIAARALAQPNAVGLSIAVAKGDQVVFAGSFGKADLETGFAGDKDTLFRIGSVTKQFTAAAVMKLVEQGKLSLDDTLAKLLPDFPATPKPVTLRQLLNHTSGIWSYTSDDKFMGREATLELTPAELVAIFKDHAPDFDPGTKWNYSNSGYYLLGEIIAKTSGKTYAQFVQDELLTPQGLARTRYESNREIIPNRAQGYTYEKGKLFNDKSIGADVPGAAGSLLSSAEGLVRWNLALASGKVVSPKSYEQMSTSATLPDGSETRYGFGLQLGVWEGRPRVAHGGGIFGFTSQLTYLPKDQLTIAVISNCDGFNPAKLADSIARAALGISDFVPADLAVSAQEIARFAGEYKFVEFPMEISIFERDGKMWSQAVGQKETRLHYQGKGEFRADFDPQVKIVFTEGTGPADQFVLHQGGEHPANRKK